MNAAPLSEAEPWIATYRDFWETRADALVEHVERRARAQEGRGS